MHNHAGGTEQLIAAVGRERVLLGFPGASGSREGAVVRYLLNPQQPTTLGEIEGPPTARVQQIAEVLRDAGFPVAISENMDSWLKTHAVFVTAVCGALCCAGGDNYQLRGPQKPWLCLQTESVKGCGCSERSVFRPRRSTYERSSLGCREALHEIWRVIVDIGSLALFLLRDEF
jgi:ketopantoate reductase